MSEVNLLFPGAGLADLGLRSVDDGGTLFCPLTEAFAINNVTYKWPAGSLIRWHLAFDRLGSLSDMDLKGMREANLAEIAAACDLRFEYTSNPKTANLLGITAQMDGPSGVLADHQIPMPGANASKTQLLGRFDLGERWGLYEGHPPAGKIDAGRVDLHELLHAMGLGHKPESITDPALIEARYSPYIRHLQEADKRELRRRHGPSKAEPKDDPRPIPPASGSSEKPVFIDLSGIKVSQPGLSSEWVLPSLRIEIPRK